MYNKRSSGGIKFILLRDGTGIVQCVVLKGNVKSELFALCEQLTQESSVIITGKVREDCRAPGGIEIVLENLEVLQIAQPYPISLKEHGVDFLMEYRHLWLRAPRQQAILRIRNEVIKSIRNFFDNQGFILIDAPIFTPTACEGTTSLFETKYFDTQAYLTQSGQLYMEAAASAFGKVYCFGPTFRAEKSKTRRHLTEFWMVEPEVAYAELSDIILLAEEMITQVIKQVLRERRSELEELGREIQPLEKVKPPFPKISYDEALEILKKHGHFISWGEDFGGDEETILSQQFELPVFILNYPKKCKAFYMKEDPTAPERVLCLDVLAPEGKGEIIGGGQREDDLAKLENRLQEANLPREAFGWYLDLRKYGSVPHAGFGLGIERFVAWICSLHHVRETIPFPRLLYRLYP